jgi:hypothetical protein
MATSSASMVSSRPVDTADTVVVAIAAAPVSNSCRSAEHVRIAPRSGSTRASTADSRSTYAGRGSFGVGPSEPVRSGPGPERAGHGKLVRQGRWRSLTS